MTGNLGHYQKPTRGACYVVRKQSERVLKAKPEALGSDYFSDYLHRLKATTEVED